jgi:vancomycin resistance protein VanW
MKKPKKRTRVRVICGTIFYTCKKYLYWYASQTKFAKQAEPIKKAHKVITHKTKLLRELKDIDMWMQYNKIENLKLALTKVNKITIKPGEVFSYWREIGNPTTRKGYKSGMILHNGTVQKGIGGGLCQLSNLIYWITLHTPLTVIERWRHGYDVFPDVKRKQPFGSGATCAYPNIDLQIANNTDQTFQIQLELSKTHLIGSWLCTSKVLSEYKVYEKAHVIKNEWWGGYTRNNTIHRRVSDRTTKKLLRDEFVTKNEAIMMYDPFLEARS